LPSLTYIQHDFSVTPAFNGGGFHDVEVEEEVLSADVRNFLSESPCCYVGRKPTM